MYYWNENKPTRHNRESQKYGYSFMFSAYYNLFFSIFFLVFHVVYTCWLLESYQWINENANSTLSPKTHLNLNENDMQSSHQLYIPAEVIAVRLHVHIFIFCFVIIIQSMNIFPRFYVPIAICTLTDLMNTFSYNW